VALQRKAVCQGFEVVANIFFVFFTFSDQGYIYKDQGKQRPM